MSTKTVDFPSGALATPTDPTIQKATLELLRKQAELADLQAEELLRAKAERQEKVEIKKRAKESNLETIRKNLDEIKSQQEACIHRKPAPSHESALAGQRDHQQVTHYVCQYCAKPFTDKTVPPNLRIPADRVGGPIY